MIFHTGMISSRPKKCQYTIPVHVVSLQAPWVRVMHEGIWVLVIWVFLMCRLWLCHSWVLGFTEPGLGVDGPCDRVNITDLFIVSYVGLFYTIVAHCCHIDTGCRPVPDQVKPSFVIFDCPEHQSARMSKITNDCLTRSVTGCFIADPYDNSGPQRANCGFVIKGLSQSCRKNSNYST